MAMNQKEYRKQLAETFVHVLEEKALDWKKEWRGLAPVNGQSGRRYRGINRLYLSLISRERDYDDSRWYTFKQITEHGWKLENAKGQGVKVEYWFPYDRKKKTYISWDEFRRGDEKDPGRYVLYAKYYTVFNGSLIDGIPEIDKGEDQEIHPDELIETLSSNMHVPIQNDGGDRAYYSVHEDQIHLPKPEYFNTEYAYGSTALHELAHATGAPHRLNRKYGARGGEDYAFEELVAEISSCFMSVNLRTEQTAEHIENHKAYVQSWVKSIREKPETLARAVSQAEKTAAYMEYHAGLIEEKEYEKAAASSMETSLAIVPQKKLETEKNQDKKITRRMQII